MEKHNKTNELPVAGVFVPGTTKGYIAESRFIKGGYVVVQTLEERDRLIDRYKFEDNEAVVNGQPVYVACERATYRYDAVRKTWEKDLVASASSTQRKFDEIDRKLATIPTKVSQLDNDVNYATIDDVVGYNKVSDILYDIEGETIRSFGNIPAGTNLDGLTLKQVLQLAYYQVSNPTFTDPSLSVDLDTLYGLYGYNLTLYGTLHYDRGTIDPAYETDGYRAGKAVYYKVNGDAKYFTDEDEYAFEYEYENIKAGIGEVEFSVYHEAGQQPTTSIGTDYDEPYPEGEITVTATVYGITPAWVGVSIDDMKEVPFEVNSRHTFFDERAKGKGAGYNVIVPCERSYDERQTFALPDFLEVKGIKVFDDIKGRFSWLYGSPEASLEYFPKTDLEFTCDYGGKEVPYAVYQSSEDEQHLITSRRLMFYTELPKKVWEGEGDVEKN